MPLDDLCFISAAAVSPVKNSDNVLTAVVRHVGARNHRSFSHLLLEHADLPGCSGGVYRRLVEHPALVVVAVTAVGLGGLAEVFSQS